MNDEINELEGLRTIETNSPRENSQGFDLNHNAESNYFEVSDTFYDMQDMNNNGFTAHWNPRTESVLLSVQSNEDSVSYRGREGSRKTKKFKATSPSELFAKQGLVGDLSLEEVGTKDGATYFRVETIENEEITEEVSEDTEVTIEEEPDVQEEADREYAENAVEESTNSF